MTTAREIAAARQAREEQTGLRGTTPSQSPSPSPAPQQLTNPAPYPTGGAGWRDIPGSDAIANAPGGRFGMARTNLDAIQGAVSGVLDAGAEALDAMGALGAAWNRWAGPIVLGEERFEELQEERAENTRRMNRFVGVQVIDPDRADGEFFPNAERVVATPDSTVGQLADGIAQFVTGYATAGRLLGTARNLTLTQAIGRGFVQGAAADFTVFDGNEARLSNLLRDHAGLRDPVTAYLAADADDDEALGRIKSVLEGAGIGIVAETLFAGLRALRIQRNARTNPGPQTESQLADAARAVHESMERTSAAIAEQSRIAARQYRVTAINADAQAALSRLDQETFGEALNPAYRELRNVTPTAEEAAAIARGDVPPTFLSVRQRAVLDDYNRQKAEIESRREEALQLEQARSLAESGGQTSAVLQTVREINNARAVRSADYNANLQQNTPRMNEGGAGRAGPQAAESAGPMSPPIRVYFGRGGAEAVHYGNEIVISKMGQHYPIESFTARFDADGNVRLFPKERGARVDPLPAEGEVTFTTARGSTYTVQSSGSTIRNKAARTDPGHEGQSGIQQPSDRTVYVTSEVANALATPQGGWRVHITDDGISLLTPGKEGRWGISPSQRNLPYEREPRQGLTPVEVWNADDTASGAFRKIHFGNEIVSVSRGSAGTPMDRTRASLAEAARGPRQVDNEFANPLYDMSDADAAFAERHSLPSTGPKNDLPPASPYSHLRVADLEDGTGISTGIGPGQGDDFIFEAITPERVTELRGLPLHTRLANTRELIKEAAERGLFVRSLGTETTIHWRSPEGWRSFHDAPPGTQAVMDELHANGWDAEMRPVLKEDVFNTEMERAWANRSTSDEALSAPVQRRIEPSSHTIDIIPGHPIKADDMVRVARSLSSRMATEADAGGRGVAVVGNMTAEADRISALADELAEAIRTDVNVNKIGARLYQHLSAHDEALAELFPRRPANEPINRAIGQTAQEDLDRALGRTAPESIEIDEDFVEAIARGYAGSEDVASVTVAQLRRNWREGDPVTRVLHPNMDRITGPDQLLAFLARFDEMTEGAVRRIRGETAGVETIGVRSDLQMQKTARALARDYGTDAESLINRVAQITGSTQNLDSKLTALRMLHVSAADEAQRLMRVYISTNSEEALSRALHSLQAFSVIHSAVRGTSSEIARALRSMRTTVSRDRSLVEQFQSIVDESVLRAIDPQGNSRNALDALQILGGKVADATSRRGIARAFEPKWHRAVEDLWTASILSAPSTHVLNTIGNAFTTLATPVERMVSGIARADGAAIRESVDHAHALLLTSVESWRLARRAFMQNRTFLDSTFTHDFRSNFRAEAFGVNPDQAFGRGLNAFGKVVGVVNRFMGAQDEFWKQMNYRSYLYASAMREGRQVGLRGEGLATYVDEFVTKGFTGEGRSIRAGVRRSELDIRNNAYDRALQVARRNTFTEDTGPILGALERGLREIPLGRLVIPFYRTPINIVKYAARRTGIAVPIPGVGWRGIGLSKTFMEDIAGRNGRAVQEQAIGMMMVGTTAYGSALVLAMNGYITGSGPSDPNVRRALQESGWQPYSIRLGNKYISYNRADPFGMFFSVVADIHELANETWSERPDDPIEMGALTIVELAQMLRDKTFFQGIDTIFSALEDQADPDQELENVERLLGQYAGGFLSPSIVSRATDDGFMHRPRSIADAVIARSPWRSNVEYRRNWIGEPLGSGNSLYNPAFISPVQMRDAGDDRVLNEIAMLAVESRGGLAQMEKRIHGVDLTNYTSPVTNRNAYDRLQELTSEVRLNGRTLREDLERLFDSPRWERMTSGSVEGELEARGSRQTALSRVRRRYQNEAERQLRREIPELHAQINRAEALQRQRRRQNPANEGGLPDGLEWLTGNANE